MRLALIFAALASAALVVAQDVVGPNPCYMDKHYYIRDNANCQIVGSLISVRTHLKGKAHDILFPRSLEDGGRILPFAAGNACKEGQLRSLPRQI